MIMVNRLQQAVDPCRTMEELVNAFFDTVGNAGGEIEYVGGTLPAIYLQPGCRFTLQYSLQREDGEFYQLSMEVRPDTGDEVFPYDHKLYDENDGDLREYILNSELFNMLKDKKVLSVDVFDGET